MRELALIVAIGENGAIGRAGRVPWDYPEDRAHFARLTRGHAVIMGRRTWEETGGPLPDRTNIVVSASSPKLVGAHVVRTLDEALALAWSTDPLPFVIGGTRLFDEALPRVTRAFVTLVPEAPDADTFYRFEPAGFHLASEREGERGARFQEWVRSID